MLKPLGLVNITRDGVEAGLAIRIGGEWTVRTVGHSPTIADALEKLASSGAPTEIHVQLSSKGVFWSVVALSGIRQAERSAAIQLQEERFRSEHPEHEVRSHINSTGERVLLAGVPSSILREIQTAVQHAGVRLRSIVPAPLSALGHLPSPHGTTCLIAAEGLQTNVTVYRHGLREVSATLQCDLALVLKGDETSGEHLNKAVQRQQIATTEAWDRIVLVTSQSPESEQQATFAEHLKRVCPAPLEWKVLAGIEPVFTSCSGLLYFPQEQTLPCNFAVQSQHRSPHRWSPYWPAFAAAGVVLAGWVGWQYWSARQAKHLAALQTDLQDLQQQVDALQPEAQRYTYLQQEWKSTDWLPPFTQLADSAPTQLCEFERLAMDTDPQGGTRVRVEGRAKQPEPILKWNQTLLEHRQGFDLVPHAIEQGTDQSSFPHRFIIELELPQPGPAEDQT